VTDEVSAVQLLGRQVIVVENAEPNFKITYPGDLGLAESVLQHRSGRGGSG
jgi:2-C-methyl-D-erythritol 4-phosphate cytidylyltransferase